MKLYKLTEQNGSTQNNTFWGTNVTHSKRPTNNPQLCSSDVFHAYTDVNLAFLLNPIHANIENPVLWECQGNVVVSDFGKVGCFELTTKKQMKTPKWVNSERAIDIRILFAVLCAESVLNIFESAYPDDNRPRKAIEASKRYLQNKDAYASYAAADAATYAARAAAYAADAAADYASYVARAADYAAYAARAAAYAAYAAADYAADYAAADYAADHAADAARAASYGAIGNNINFAQLAQQAIDFYMK